MKYIITGDCHGRFDKFKNLTEDKENTAIIILGDAGCNFYLDDRDNKTKRTLVDYGYTYYLVRGNHEERPENIKTMFCEYDDNVKNSVFFEKEYPSIKYLIDGEVYNFNGHTALVIGGAYSVDKYYRLANYKNKRGWSGWFKDEQLTTEEMSAIEHRYKGQHFDFVLSHTCPYSYEPTDMFLSFVDQSTVDNSMEKWMDKFRRTITYNVWAFGHFHNDRVEAPHIEMFYNDFEDIELSLVRWYKYEESGELDWWIHKSPKFYMEKE